MFLRCLCDDGFTGSSCVEAGKSSLNIKEDSASKFGSGEKKSDVQNDMKTFRNKSKSYFRVARTARRRQRAFRISERKHQSLRRKMKTFKPSLMR